jgi:hypothetical protein
MLQNIYLNDFIERFNEQPMLRDTIFPELYDEHIIPTSKLLQNEVNENMLTLPSMDRENYLNYVKNRIISETIGTLGSSIINKWTEKFNLEKNEFPFIDNEKIKALLSTWGNQPGLSYKKQILVKYMQKDFYLYAFYLESEKIVKLIDLLLISITNGSPSVEKIKFHCFKKMPGASKKKNITSLFDALAKKNYIDSHSKKEFINAFTGTSPCEKMNWTGCFGDLKTVIDHCIKKEFITSARNKWVITASIFKDNGKDFDNKNISDTSVTKNEMAIKRLIDSIG